LSWTPSSAKTPGGRRQIIFYGKCVNSNGYKGKWEKYGVENAEYLHLTENEGCSNINV